MFYPLLTPPTSPAPRIVTSLRLSLWSMSSAPDSRPQPHRPPLSPRPTHIPGRDRGRPGTDPEEARCLKRSGVGVARSRKEELGSGPGGRRRKEGSGRRWGVAGARQGPEGVIWWACRTPSPDPGPKVFRGSWVRSLEYYHGGGWRSGPQGMEAGSLGRGRRPHRCGDGSATVPPGPRVGPLRGPVPSRDLRRTQTTRAVREARVGPSRWAEQRVRPTSISVRGPQSDPTTCFLPPTTHSLVTQVCRRTTATVLFSVEAPYGRTRPEPDRSGGGCRPSHRT